MRTKSSVKGIGVVAFLLSMSATRAFAQFSIHSPSLTLDHFESPLSELRLETKLLSEPEKSSLRVFVLSDAERSKFRDAAFSQGMRQQGFIASSNPRALQKFNDLKSGQLEGPFISWTEAATDKSETIFFVTHYGIFEQRKSEGLAGAEAIKPEKIFSQANEQAIDHDQKLDLLLREYGILSESSGVSPSTRIDSIRESNFGSIYAALHAVPVKSYRGLQKGVIQDIHSVNVARPDSPTGTLIMTSVAANPDGRHPDIFGGGDGARRYVLETESEMKSRQQAYEKLKHQAATACDGFIRRLQ